MLSFSAKTQTTRTPVHVYIVVRAAAGVNAVNGTILLRTGGVSELKRPSSPVTGSSYWKLMAVQDMMCGHY